MGGRRTRGQPGFHGVAGGWAVESVARDGVATSGVRAQHGCHRVGVRERRKAVLGRVCSLGDEIKDSDDVGWQRDANARVTTRGSPSDAGVVEELLLDWGADAVCVHRAVEDLGVFAAIDVKFACSLRAAFIVNQPVPWPAGKSVAGAEVASRDNLKSEGVVAGPENVGAAGRPVGILVLEATGLVEAVDERGRLFPADHTPCRAGEHAELSGLQCEVRWEVDAEHVLVVGQAFALC